MRRLPVLRVRWLEDRPRDVCGRSGLRISEALKIEAKDLDPESGTVRVREGKGGKTATCGMDPWGFEQLRAWMDTRAAEFPPGPVFCVIEGPTRGGRMRSAYVRQFLKALVEETSIAKRVHPHGFRHAHACHLAREEMPMHLISRQLRHSNLGTTATYLQGIAPVEVVNAMVARRAPGGTA